MGLINTKPQTELSTGARAEDASEPGTESSAGAGADEVRTALSRVLQSRGFRNSERLQRLLKFTVECALQGTVDQLKESVLGREVFDRGSKYDPRTDSIVRVESVRLRKRLREYYEVEGRSDPVSFVFQPGSYVPTFQHVHAEQDDLRQAEGRSLEQPLLRPSTVAVLPLSNLCGDSEQEYLSDGITDEIIYALSCVRGLNVIGHTSVFALKNALLERPRDWPSSASGNRCWRQRSQVGQTGEGLCRNTECGKRRDPLGGDL